WYSYRLPIVGVLRPVDLRKSPPPNHLSMRAATQSKGRFGMIPSTVFAATFTLPLPTNKRSSFWGGEPICVRTVCGLLAPPEQRSFDFGPGAAAAPGQLACVRKPGGGL